MHVDHRFSTHFDYALSAKPARLVIPTDPALALAFAVARDREADASLAEGRFAQAERLSHIALEARARATGCQA